MANVFDQFGQVQTKRQGGNPFDRFDPPATSRNGPSRNPARRSGERSRLSADDSLSELRTMTGGFLEGIPVVGPMIRGGVERAAAGTLAALSPEHEYAEVLQMIQQGTADEKAANPGLNFTSQATGAVAGTIPMVIAAPAAFGVGAGNFGVRSGISALSGSGIGGADAAVRSGGDPDAAERGAWMGLAAGAAGPAVGQLAGAGYRSISDWLLRRGVSRATGLPGRTVTDLSRVMEADGLSPQAARQRLAELGPQGMIADLGPNLQQTAAGLVAAPGQARGIVQGAMRARDAGANQRIRTTLDETLGPAQVPFQMDDAIRVNQRALSPEYEAAFGNARRVDTQPIADTLDSMAVNLRGEAQNAVREVRRMLNVAGTDQLDPHPRTLHATRQAIDDMLASPSIGNNTAVALREIRRQVDGTLTNSVPGIQAADAKFAELARQREALQRGQTVLDSGRTAPRPQELAQEVAEGALPRGSLVGPSAVPLRLRDGARSEIDRIVGTNANDRAKLARLVGGEGDWNRQRLATLFGQERADRIIRVLDAERTFAETSDFVTRNSATAARQEAVRNLRGEGGVSVFGLREGYIAGGTPGAARAGALSAADRIKSLIIGTGRDAKNSALARGLTSHVDIAAALMGLQTPRRVTSSQVDAVARALLLSQGLGGAR